MPYYTSRSYALITSPKPYKDQEQIAIAFPRNYLQQHGFAPVLHLNHHAALRSVVKKFLDASESLRASLGPFIELNDDVSPFQELRTTDRVPLADAVWLLSTERDENKTPVIPRLDVYRASHGRIPTSFWHRTHQIGVLDEWQYVSFSFDDQNELTDFSFQGEFYAKQQPPEPIEYKGYQECVRNRLSTYSGGVGSSC